MNNNRTGFIESAKKEVFSVSAFDIENEVDVSDTQCCGVTYHNMDEALDAAIQFAQSLVGYGSVVEVRVHAGEYQTEKGDILGEPEVVYVVSNSSEKATALARKRAGYVNNNVDFYAYRWSL